MRGQRGRAKLELVISGRACHAGHAGHGINAAEALAAVVAAVRDLPAVEDPALGRRDVTCIDVHSLPYPSVSTVPGRAIAHFDCRFPPGEDTTSLAALLHGTAAAALAGWPEAPRVDVRVVPAHFTTWTGTTFDVHEFAASWWTDDPVVEQAQRAIARIGLDPTPQHYSFCTNGSYTSGVHGVPTIGFGAGEEHMAHQVDEHVSLDSLYAVAQGLAAITCEILQVSAP
jgi:acetylornithine deacetylase/succinyl-diaminopimelate desuccinylase-like protein